ncbi:MAG: uroporphyrinogen-III synthase [Legionellaceae bacterium]|nr:uroporphyrinogen-III synthase [Legionellaceae bacterium]
MSESIRQAGGVSIELPTLAIEPTPTTWLTQCPSLSSVQQAIFVSPNAVRYFYMELYQSKIHWPSNIQVTAIGQGTAQALKSLGITINHGPSIPDSEHVLALSSLQDIAQQTILLIKGQGGRELISTTLRSRGADLQPIMVYRRTLPEKNEEYTYSLWHDDAVDIILVTSQQAMQNLFVLFGELARTWITTKPCLVISQRLAEAASAFGIQTVIISRYEDILTTLEGFKHDYR